MVPLIAFGMIAAIAGYFVLLSVWTRRGFRQYHEGQTERALITYRRVARFFPRNANAYQTLASLHVELFQMEEALHYVDKAIRSSPRDVTLRSVRATILTMLERHDEAQEIYDKLILVEPDEPLVYINRALFYASMNRDAEALADLDVATEKMAALREKNDRFQPYMQNMQSRLQSYSRSIKNLHAVIYSRSGRHDEAQALYKALIAAEPDNAALFNDRAEAYFADGKYRKAQADYEHAMKLIDDPQRYPPKTRKTHFLKAIIKGGAALNAYALGRQQEALAAWHELVAEDAGHQDTDWLQARYHWSPAMIATAEAMIAASQATGETVFEPSDG